MYNNNFNFNEGAFLNSTKKRLPICFCLDVSGSMLAPTANGTTRIQELNQSFSSFIHAMQSNPEVAASADISVITFGGDVQILNAFAPLSNFRPAEIKVNEHSLTPMGEGINAALKLLEVRKQAYRSRGIKYHQPWLVVLTDGEVTGNQATVEYNKACAAVNDLEMNKKLVVFNAGIGDETNYTLLKMLSRKRSEPIKIGYTDLNRFFEFLGSSSTAIVNNGDVDAIVYGNPDSPVSYGQAIDLDNSIWER